MERNLTSVGMSRQEQVVAVVGRHLHEPGGWLMRQKNIYRTMQAVLLNSLQSPGWRARPIYISDSCERQIGSSNRHDRRHIVENGDSIPLQALSYHLLVREVIVITQACVDAVPGFHLPHHSSAFLDESRA